MLRHSPENACTGHLTDQSCEQLCLRSRFLENNYFVIPTDIALTRRSSIVLLPIFVTGGAMGCTAMPYIEGFTPSNSDVAFRSFSESTGGPNTTDVERLISRHQISCGMATFPQASASIPRVTIDADRHPTERICIPVFTKSRASHSGGLYRAS